MKTASLSIKVDPTTKSQAQDLASKLGLPLGSLVNVLLKDAIRTQSINLSTVPEQFPSEPMTPQMEKIIERAEKEIAAGEVSPAFDNLDDAFSWMEKQKD